MPTGPNARTKLMVKCRHRNTTQITNSRKYNDPKVFISGTRQPRQEIAELSNGLRKLRLDMHFLNTSLSSTITNLTIDKDCLEKENILLRKSNWKLSELVKNLTNAKNEEPHPSQVYKPCNLTDGNGCNQDEIPTTTKVLWTQDGHTLTDPTLASEVHLTKEVINNRIRYGNNSKEWLCIYTKGINISFIDGNIDAIGDLNYIQNITDQKFHFNWKLNGQPLTDPAYDSLVIINGKTLRVLLDAYNKMTRVKSYPRIQVLNTAVKVTTTLARDITPLRNPSETISIVDRGYLRYPGN